MSGHRYHNAKLNIISALTYQVIAVVCGLIVPKLLLTHYGSEAYGATTSIAQFIAYISLIEGGIGGVARAALYKPLAQKNDLEISRVIKEVRHFFFIIGGVFVIYVLILSCSFGKISKIECMGWLSSFLLVWVISFSTFLQYFVGLPYGILLQADQKNYICAEFSIITTVLNAVFAFVAVKAGLSIIGVKLISSCVYAIKPIAQNIYVKKNYNILEVQETSNSLSQKWTGLGQHIAYFLHSNTDVVVLTLFANLKTVAVYSVYNMVIANVQNIAIAFSSGMEALFGELIAKNEIDELNRTFSYYETLISFVSVILFSVTGVLITPFVMLYTKGINDVDYRAPLFAVLLLLASIASCLRLPYHSVTIAAGHFRETKLAAYGEAFINISSSIILVIRFGLIGVAIGTLIAVSFRFCYYVLYLSRTILNRKIQLFIKRLSVNTATFLCIYFIGGEINKYISVSTYVDWVIVGCMSMVIAVLSASLMQYIFYKEDFLPILKRIFCKFNKFKR